MTVTVVRKDAQALTMTLEAEFDASPKRVWQLWADPRQLERWWGPPTYPATFTKHSLAPGSRIEYHMTGPDGVQHHGYWEVVEVAAPHRLVFRDGFANADGTPNTDMPMYTARVRIEAVDGGRTRMSIETVFPSAEAMEQFLATGTEEGLTRAVGQIDAILAEEAIARRWDQNTTRRRNVTMFAQPTTTTPNGPGATLAHDIRPNSTTTEPVQPLIGSPMGDAGFGSLVSDTTDRTVVTYAPRGYERSDTGIWSSSQGKSRAAWRCPSSPIQSRMAG